MGFEGVVGATVAFVMIIGVFTGIYVIYMENIINQKQLFDDNVDRVASGLREDYDVNNVYLNSGRVKLDIENTGYDKLIFEKLGKGCFEYFFDNSYIKSSNIDIKLASSLRGDYAFLEKDDEGSIYILYNSVIPNSERVKVISCNGKKYEFYVNDSFVNLFSDSYYEKSILNISPQIANRENINLTINLDSNDFNISNYKNPKFEIMSPIDQNEILNLPMDTFNQNMKDYSFNNYITSLGNDASIEAADPESKSGVVIKGLDFEVGDYLRVNNFDFDNEKHTISFWFKSKTELNSSSPAKDFFNISSEYMVSFNKGGLGEIGFYRYNGAILDFSLVSNTREWKEREWYNIIIVLDNDNSHKFFVNGDLETTFGANLNGNSVTGLVIGNVE